MPQYLSTDPNAGQAPAGGGYLSTDPNAGTPVEAGTSRLSRLGAGAKEGATDLLQFVKAVDRDPLGIVRGLGAQFVEGAKAVPDVVRNLVNPETRGATARGFAQGATEGATGVTGEEAVRDPWRAAGKAGVNVAALLAPGLPKGIKGAAQRVRGARLAANDLRQSAEALANTQRVVPAAEVAEMEQVARGLGAGKRPGLVAGTPQTFEQVAIEALEELRQPAAPARVSLPPPAAQPRVSFKQLAPAKARPVAEPPTVPVEAPAAPVAPPAADVAAPFSAPETRLPAGWRPPEGAVPKVTGLKSDDIARFQGAEAKAPVMTQQVKDWMQRRFHGQEVSRDEMIAAAVEDWGRRRTARAFGLKYDDLVQQFPERRVPNLAQEAIAEYERRGLINERGFIDPKLAAQISLPVAGAVAGGAVADEHPAIGAVLGGLTGLAAANPVRTLRGANALRVTGMLSGAAPLKSLAGNVGAIGTAAAERGSLAPIREALRVPTNMRVAKEGWKSRANPAAVEGMNRINLPGRVMGALDQTTTQALQRAGLSLEEAQRLLLTRPNPLGPEAGKVLQSGIGRFVFPFQRTPFNIGLEGLKELAALKPGSGASATRRALTVGATGAGAVAGETTDNKLLLGILAALAGPRAVPFALGAGATGGNRLIEQIGVGFPEGSWKDLYDPLRPINRPALLRLLEGEK